MQNFQAISELGLTLFQLDVNELTDQGGVAFDITDGHDEKGETTNVRNGLKY